MKSRMFLPYEMCPYDLSYPRWYRGSPRRRDNCPVWVKEESLEKAKQKRKMRADKLEKQFN